MKLGFNLLLWTTHVVDEHVPLFDRLKAVGYDGVEIPLFEGEVSHYERLGSKSQGRRARRKRGDGDAVGQECHRRRGGRTPRKRSII